MEIKLKKEEGIKLLYLACPRCHRPFNKKKRKKTAHHAIPKFLNPRTEITISLCELCHKELNETYKGYEIMAHKHKKKSGSFEEFKENYLLLRERFHKKEIHRGQFGEGLWSNLVSFLESKEKTAT